VAYKVTQLILGFLLYLHYLFPDLFDSNQLINQGYNQELIMLHDLYVSIPMKSISYHADTGLLTVVTQNEVEHTLACRPTRSLFYHPGLLGLHVDPLSS
jgi:type III secretory pathway component EscR